MGGPSSLLIRIHWSASLSRSRLVVSGLRPGMTIAARAQSSDLLLKFGVRRVQSGSERFSLHDLKGAKRQASKADAFVRPYMDRFRDDLSAQAEAGFRVP